MSYLQKIYHLFKPSMCSVKDRAVTWHEGELGSHLGVVFRYFCLIVMFTSTFANLCAAKRCGVPQDIQTSVLAFCDYCSIQKSDTLENKCENSSFKC